ncbi:unnamed protein product [Albugo candida]|uniref:Uncharacterized protein n=1 Tax=Albugo candida TaxID=65357 RepID=A0A024GTN7_9STRA|nr:unnamed protein product [Albugo candida]|eukprot:CCI50079.1 unnamed protein product [Albugo candida]
MIHRNLVSQICCLCFYLLLVFIPCMQYIVASPSSIEDCGRGCVVICKHSLSVKEHSNTTLQIMELDERMTHRYKSKRSISSFIESFYVLALQTFMFFLYIAYADCMRYMIS